MTAGGSIILLLLITSSTNAQSRFILFTKYNLIVSKTRVITYYLPPILMRKPDSLKLYLLYSIMLYFSLIGIPLLYIYRIIYSGLVNFYRLYLDLMYYILMPFYKVLYLVASKSRWLSTLWRV